MVKWSILDPNPASARTHTLLAASCSCLKAPRVTALTGNTTVLESVLTGNTSVLESVLPNPFLFFLKKIICLILKEESNERQQDNNTSLGIAFYGTELLDAAVAGLKSAATLSATGCATGDDSPKGETK